jgi:hypothetical protein
MEAAWGSAVDASAAPCPVCGVHPLIPSSAITQGGYDHNPRDFDALICWQNKHDFFYAASFEIVL